LGDFLGDLLREVFFDILRETLAECFLTAECFLDILRELFLEYAIMYLL
jgi:hypothetical protein